MAARETKPNGKSQLIRDLKNGEFATLYILYGEESLPAENTICGSCSKRVVDETFADFNLIELDGKTSDARRSLTEASRQLSGDEQSESWSS